eukprot:CAMPEP_0113729774 /NCGR_PEP_ID=MMETSP0038_2-20120614/42763_1 /TAXON_ID=2898 /ORGANISM="Cryptomonas paramecium" /LENGTH=155 /DNA_ID=CAMNT_0000661707 /DNA_START=42 /DNA_END=509 /DNA_ORIENTATION=+ /assembly_acc=CAM_ASM_000170
MRTSRAAEEELLVMDLSEEGLELGDGAVSKEYQENGEVDIKGWRRAWDMCTSESVETSSAMACVHMGAKTKKTVTFQESPVNISIAIHRAQLLADLLDEVDCSEEIDDIFSGWDFSRPETTEDRASNDLNAIPRATINLPCWDRCLEAIPEEAVE